MKHIEVVAAVIVKDDKYLCVQRPWNKYDYISKKFEFPGGKIEPQESKVDAIIREIKEELILDISVIKEYVTVDYQYPDFKITMYSFLCEAEDYSKFELTEHIDSYWLESKELDTLDWAAADLPIVHELMS